MESRRAGSAGAVRRVRGLGLLAALGLLTFACRTAPLPEPFVVELPPTMTDQQAEVAVLSGILNVRPPEEYDPTVALAEDEFAELVWKHFARRSRGRSWAPEAREADRIYAAVNTRGHYLRAVIERLGDRLRIRIVESRNLLQGDGRIHRRAIQWLRNLEAHIRREIGRMAMVERMR